MLVMIILFTNIISDPSVGWWWEKCQCFNDLVLANSLLACIFPLFCGDECTVTPAPPSSRDFSII